MKRTLIFDFDGTLADSLSLVLGIANEILQEMKHRPITDEDVEKMRKMTIPQGFKYLGIPVYKLPQLVVKSRQKMKENINQLLPIAGVVPVLEKLKASGVQMGIVTSNSTENVRYFLKRHKIDGLFSFVDAGSNPFSKSRRIKSTIAKNGLSPDQCYYIGDEIRDIEAAKSLGVEVIAVGWGINHPTSLKQHNPDYFVTKPEQLLEFATDK